VDTKLRFKPIELIDIGIDKHTKMPMPILSDNIIYTNDVVDGIPINTFTLTVSTLSFDIEINNVRNISLSVNYGDGTTATLTGTTIIDNHTFLTTTPKTIQFSGDLDKITGMTCMNCGLKSAYITKLIKISHLNLSGNTLEEINLDGLVSLNNIDLSYNSLNASAIDDVFIYANTFLTYAGQIDVRGTNNAYPSIYSETARDNLINNKLWTLYCNV